MSGQEHESITSKGRKHELNILLGAVCNHPLNKSTMSQTRPAMMSPRDFSQPVSSRNHAPTTPPSTSPLHHISFGLDTAEPDHIAAHGHELEITHTADLQYVLEKLAEKYTRELEHRTSALKSSHFLEILALRRELEALKERHDTLHKELQEANEAGTRLDEETRDTRRTMRGMAEADKVLRKKNVELKEELRELKREIEWGGGEEERREAERQVLRVMDDIAAGS